MMIELGTVAFELYYIKKNEVVCSLKVRAVCALRRVIAQNFFVILAGFTDILILLSIIRCG